MVDVIKLENVDFVYQEGTPFEFLALKDVSLSIKKGEMAGIIGPTGSGKSTLIQHFNGLLRPTRGKVLVSGRDINDKRNEPGKKKKGVEEKKIPPICFEVGVVFQYPEYQLFEETVYEDIAFGPRNMDLPEDKVKNRVMTAMEWMDLDFSSMKDRSPFSLSGGEMRRVALAGVLAMQPEVLVLDEPSAGLDPRGRIELQKRIRQFHDELGMTLVMVSHDMGDVARMVDHLIVIDRGRIVADGAPSEIFKKQDWIREMGMGVPPYMDLMNRLKSRGFDVRGDVLDLEEAVSEILRLARGGKGVA